MTYKHNVLTGLETQIYIDDWYDDDIYDAVTSSRQSVFKIH